ncbi:uncharacterized protein LOC142348376 isoform X1 [Convolutriloba macropyga]|uniref:uncharacterized protein LOC142348376 isoform X1 n=1 Tax=Convolutriloba macropyga TaxID=536237 RepID=UPI003F51F23E
MVTLMKISAKIHQKVLEYERFHIKLYAVKSKKCMPSLSGSAGVCPLCEVKKDCANMGYLRKCLLSFDPHISISLCSSPDCAYYESTSSLEQVPLPEFITREYTGLDTILFLITRSVYLRLSFQNNNIPGADLLSRILYLSIERKQHIYEIRNYVLLNCGNFICDDVIEGFHCLSQFSPFLKKAFATRCSTRVDCERQCKNSIEEESHFINVNELGYMELSLSPTVVLSGNACRRCKQRSANRYVHIEPISDFVLVKTSKGIHLPFQIGKTSFQTNDGGIFRLHSVTTESDSGWDSYLCDSMGHLREQFSSDTKVAVECSKKLASLKSTSIRYVLFEKVFDTQTNSRSIERKKVENNKRSPNKLSSPIKFGPIGKKPRLYTEKTDSEKPFSSYVSQRKSGAQSLFKNEQGDALMWRKQLQKRVSTLSKNSRKTKVSDYIATLQSLNMQILDSENKLGRSRDDNNSTPHSFAKFSTGPEDCSVSSRIESPVSFSSVLCKSKNIIAARSVSTLSSPNANEPTLTTTAPDSEKSLQSFPSVGDSLDFLDFNFDALDCLAPPADFSIQTTNSMNNNSKNLLKDNSDDDFFEQMLKNS